MNELSIKNQDKVLKVLSRLCRESSTPWLYRPVGFEQHFSFISTDALIDILEILSDKEYISVQYADLPDSFNIDTLQVTPKGLNYRPQKLLEAKERWLERLYGFIVGTVLGAVVTYFIPKVLDYILGNIR